MNLIKPGGCAASVKSQPSTFTPLLGFAGSRGGVGGVRRWGGNAENAVDGSPKRRRLGELLVETLLAEQPVGRHLAFALDVGGSAVFDVVSADLRQSIPRRLAQMDTPRRPGRLHPRGGVHRVAE